jgi:carboxyl-terminal processing protease
VPDKTEIFSGFIAAVVIFLTLFASGIFLLGDPFYRESSTFINTAYEIAALYPLDYLQQLSFDGAEKGIFSLLDPFSQRVDRSTYRQMVEESGGEYGGIGITILSRDTVLMIVSVREGAPAYTAGIKSGDLIVAVDGVPVPRVDPESATPLIRGRSGTEVKLTLFRPAIADTLQITLTRSSIKLEHLPYYGITESGAAYIRIADFEAGVTKDLAGAVMELEAKSPIGYVIDLLGNPGGYLEESIDAASLFLDEGTLIVGTDGRSRWLNQRYVSRRQPLTTKPIVILTDRGTASAAEIFTGALGGADKAVVIGDTTFGKGLVQSTFALPDGDAIRLTVSRYYFADGRYLNPPDSALSFSGLPPDIIVRDQGELAFQELILAGFLLYDFADAEWPLLAGYPDQFNFPDTVVTLFQEFAHRKNVTYLSILTRLLAATLDDQRLQQAPRPVTDQLTRMAALSAQIDADAYRRNADFLKISIRRIVVEKKSGRPAVYRDVIVPTRSDIRLAVELLRDPERYRQALTGPVATVQDTDRP